MTLLLMVLLACNGGDEQIATGHDISAFVKTTPVANGTMERTLELTGTIEAGRSADLVTDIPGKVKLLPVRIGDDVKKGQLLAQLDVDMAALQRQQAQAMVRLAELALDTSQRELSRAEQLHSKGSLPDQQFDQARAGADMAQQQLAQAIAAQGLAREQVEGGRLLAPFDGVVSAVAVEEGEYFNPMTMSPMMGGGLVSLVNVDTVRVDLQVADSDISRIEKGMSARIFIDVIADQMPEGGVLGTVETVGLAADPMSRTFPVRVVAPNEDRLMRPGMHGRIRLVLEKKEGVDYVPDEAVRSAQGQEYVMVVQDTTPQGGTGGVKSGIAERVPVETGLDGDQGIEIRSDLDVGTPVIHEGNFGLPDGARVQVSEAVSDGD